MKKFFTIILLCVLFIIASEIFLKCISLISNIRKIQSEDNTAAKKILCLGDSFTYGWGANADSNYPSQLEYLLNSNNHEEKFQVINLGALGISTSIIANNLDSYLKEYNPDITIILTGANDHWNIKDSNVLYVKDGYNNGINKFYIKSKIFLYNFRTFRVLQLVCHKIACKVKNISGGTKETIGLSNITDSNLLKELIRFNYIKMIQVLGSPLHKTELFFQTYPGGPEHVNEVIRQVANSYGTNLIDQQLLFLKENQLDGLVSSDGWHLNAKGYNLMAVNIYNAFLLKGIIKNKLINNYQVTQVQAFPDEVIQISDGWKFNLSSIALHPEKIITPIDNGWYLFANNTIELPEIELDSGEYELQITAKGTPVNKIYPLVGFYYKSDMCVDCQKKEINKVYVNKEWENYLSGKIKIKNKQKIIFYVSFENDELQIRPGKREDRNLWISQIVLKAASK